MIYVECLPDRTLVKVLGVPKRKIEHAGDKGRICNRLEKTYNSKGLIDEDPLSSQPNYIKRLKLISSDKGEIRLLYDEKAENHLIILSPRLEGWILKAAKEAEVDIRKHGLPDEEHELHKVINMRLKEFENFLEEIRKNINMLKTLEGFIKDR